MAGPDRLMRMSVIAGPPDRLIRMSVMAGPPDRLIRISVIGSCRFGSCLSSLFSGRQGLLLLAMAFLSISSCKLLQYYYRVYDQIWTDYMLTFLYDILELKLNP